KPYANTELFLQTCALNAVRMRYLSSARAVLSCDIDELIISRGPDTVFQSAAESWFGYKRFEGVWRYARPSDEDVVRHSDHTLSNPAKKACPPKWCLRPDGPLKDLQWRSHELEGFHLNWVFRTKTFYYLHCFDITTGWKRGANVHDYSKLEVASKASDLVGIAENQPQVRSGRSKPLIGGYPQYAYRGMRDAVLRRFVRTPWPWQIVGTAIALLCCILFFGDLDGNWSETDFAMLIRTMDNSKQMHVMLNRVDTWF
ncbi:MAG: hypothetical protein ACKVKF_00720, partial [Rhodobacterales bacterium]